MFLKIILPDATEPTSRFLKNGMVCKHIQQRKIKVVCFISFMLSFFHLVFSLSRKRPEVGTKISYNLVASSQLCVSFSQVLFLTFSHDKIIFSKCYSHVRYNKNFKQLLSVWFFFMIIPFSFSLAFLNKSCLIGRQKNTSSLWSCRLRILCLDKWQPCWVQVGHIP